MKYALLGLAGPLILSLIAFAFYNGQSGGDIAAVLVAFASSVAYLIMLVVVVVIKKAAMLKNALIGFFIGVAVSFLVHKLVDAYKTNFFPESMEPASVALDK